MRSDSIWWLWLYDLIGNSGPLADNIAAAIESGIWSPPPCCRVTRISKAGHRIPSELSGVAAAGVAYALAGSVCIDLPRSLWAMARRQAGLLKDIWPTNQEIKMRFARHLTPEMFRTRYADVFTPQEVAGDSRHGKQKPTVAE